MKVTEITAKIPEQKELIRLAAYCRVSSDSADQLHSFATQIKYYKEFEKNNPEYTLVDIYADEGITGTCMKKRDEFNRMIRDCKKNKIDRIIVKSVSRFARNTEEMLVTLRLLKELGVSVYFEEQGIDTDQMNTEMIVTFPGMAAQQESMSISENLRWSYKKRMEAGEFNCTCPAYGYNLVNGNLEINEAESEIIKLIYNLYLQGLGITKIAKTLEDMGIQRRNANRRWHPTTIKYILGNERYMGDSLLQKTYATGIIPFKQKKNRGEHDQYYIENSHPAIISREIFEAAKNLKEKRKTNDGLKRTDYPLSKKLYCPECGRAFRRQISHGVIYWQCSGRTSGETNCQSRRLKETSIYEAFCEMTCKLKRYREELIDKFIHQLEAIQNHNSITQSKIRLIDKKIADFAAQNLVVTRLYTKGILENTDYTTQTDAINMKIYDLRVERKRILDDDETEALIETLKYFNELISEYELSTNFDEVLFEEIVESIQVDDSTQITFKLTCGLEFTETIAKRGRCNVA
ncbi:MAG: recombinase family protein [Clostridia bacterium]|nr:recombinase family protein [Clostridia bacterium]